MIDPVSKIAGARRYSFSAQGSGQRILFQRCYARNGRHSFVTGQKTVGPTVFVDCLSESSLSDIGPHHRWSVGQLYDNVVARHLTFRPDSNPSASPAGPTKRLYGDGGICVQDRGNSGTGHGWSGANQMFWNCDADFIISQQPPTAQNWCVGAVGRKEQGLWLLRPDGLWDSPGHPVLPRSLFQAQLQDRLGQAALAAITTAEQRAGTITSLLQRRFGGEKPYPAAKPADQGP